MYQGRPSGRTAATRPVATRRAAACPHDCVQGGRAAAMSFHHDTRSESAADLHAKEVTSPGLWKQRKREVKQVEEQAGAPGEARQGGRGLSLGWKGVTP